MNDSTSRADRHTAAKNPASDKRLRAACRLFTLLGVVLLAACAQPEHSLTRFEGRTMGTTYSIKVTDLPASVDADLLHADIDATLAAINASMSTYIESSELSLINRHRDNQPISLSLPMLTVLQEATHISDISDNTFNITVGPLVNLWGFGPQARPDKVPTDSEIEQAWQHIGMEKIELDAEHSQLRKLDPDVYLDLSAIAKGYAVDRVAELVEQRNIVNYMVEIGGELRVRGTNPDAVAWRIAVEKPDAEVRQPLYVIEPGDTGIATSGDYRNYFEEDGLRYSHTIDPRTGRPIRHNLASVTVLDAQCMRADALATALMVMGPEQGMQLAEKQNLAALFLVKTPDGFDVQPSTRFKPYLRH